MPDSLEKINSRILYALSYIIRDEHPDLIISLTDVKTTPDLEHSDIMVSDLHDDEKIVDKLNLEARTLRKLLAGSIKLRKTPQIRFFLDRSGSNYQRIDELLDK